MGQCRCDIEGGLSAHTSKQCIGFLDFENALDDFWKKRFDVDTVGHLGVVLDGCWIGIDEDDFVSVGAQGAAGLTA